MSSAGEVHAQWVNGLSAQMFRHTVPLDAAAHYANLTFANIELKVRCRVNEKEGRKSFNFNFIENANNK